MTETQQGKLSPLGLQATLGSFGALRSFRVVGMQSRVCVADGLKIYPEYLYVRLNL